MKITWITARHPPNAGGMARSSERLVNALTDAGMSVQVIHLSSKATLRKGKHRLLDKWHRTEIPGVTVPTEPERIFAVCREDMRDTVIVGFGGDYPAYLATLWSGWLATSSIALFRGNDFEKTIHDAKRAWITHFVLQNTDAIGAVSSEMVNRISTMTRAAIRFTPNSVDTTEWRFFDDDLRRADDFRQTAFKKGRPIVALFGQLKSKKGLDLTLKLFDEAGLSARADLLTVGDLPPELHELDRPFWIHVPFQRGDRLPTYFGAADVVFLPSYYDGMPNVLLEAMALGRIVVASRAGGIVDVIEDRKHGFLFDIGDIDGARSALEEALSLSESERSSLGRAARERVARDFSGAREIEALTALIEIAQQKRHGS